MKYAIDVHDFSFKKIKNGTRRISIHLFDKNAQQIKLNDTINMRNTVTEEHLECNIKGIAIFDNFDDLIDILGYEALGYDNKKEVMVRIKRIFPLELQKNLNAVAFFLEKITDKPNLIERGEIER